MDNHNEEPRIAPEPNRWYNITLGPSLLNNNHSYSPKFCTLRYEFKPASIDDTKPGLLHKSKENKVTLEFQNNQVNKTKVRFDGVSEDYDDRDKDAILFFDGENFRLEKLHRAVKRLKYLRDLDESSAVSRVVTKVVVPPVADAVKPVKMAQIDINNPVDFEEDVNIDDDDEDENDGEKPAREEINNPVSLEHENEEDPYSSATNRIVDEVDEDVNIDDDGEDDNDGEKPAREEIISTKEFQTGGLDIDINLPHPAEMEEDEIAVVDINDDESYKGLNAAEALRAQVNAEAREEDGKSSSSGSGRESESCESGVESSGSGSSSSSGSRNSGSEGGTASESGSRASH